MLLSDSFELAVTVTIRDFSSKTCPAKAFVRPKVLVNLRHSKDCLLTGAVY